jgi:pimeloyl-ACP methyl ester carboxylesterase
MRKYTPEIFRTRLARDIVAEVALPEHQTGRVVILAIGAPSGSSKKERIEFLTSQGLTVVYPRYRGTWESGGWFLAKSPAEDIRDVAQELAKAKSCINLSTQTPVTLKVKEVILFGWSFGGPAVLLNTDLPLVSKVIAVSPVIDWSVDGPDEPFSEFVRYSREGFMGAYRVQRAQDWNKLVKTNFYNPVAHVKKINGSKVFIIHAQDDMVVPVDPVAPFAEKTGARYYLKPTGGHRVDPTHLFLWKKIKKFLDTK